MTASLIQFVQVVLVLCTVNIVSCFISTSLPTLGRQNTALMAGGRTRKAVKGVFKKLRFDKKSNSSGVIVSEEAMAKASQNADKYSKIDDIEERAFQVLLDLGLVEKTK